MFWCRRRCGPFVRCVPFTGRGGSGTWRHGRGEQPAGASESAAWRGRGLSGCHVDGDAWLRRLHYDDDDAMTTQTTTQRYAQEVDADQQASSSDARTHGGTDEQRASLPISADHHRTNPQHLQIVVTNFQLLTSALPIQHSPRLISKRNLRKDEFRRDQYGRYDGRDADRKANPVRRAATVPPLRSNCLHLRAGDLFAHQLFHFAQGTYALLPSSEISSLLIQPAPPPPPPPIPPSDRSRRQTTSPC